MEDQCPEGMGVKRFPADRWTESADMAVAALQELLDTGSRTGVRNFTRGAMAFILTAEAFARMSRYVFAVSPGPVLDMRCAALAFSTTCYRGGCPENIAPIDFGTFLMRVLTDLNDGTSRSEEDIRTTLRFFVTLAAVCREKYERRMPPIGA